MPQLMPLLWLSYAFIFMILVLMMKSVYSLYSMKNIDYFKGKMDVNLLMWFW